MKKAFYAFLACALAGGTASAQFSITAADMPVSGDTLRWSAAIVSPTTAIGIYTQTSNNFTWNFSSLTPLTQGIDAYKSAAAVNISYAVTISPTAYGYKVADSLPVPNAPVSVKDAYTFYSKKTNPSRFVAEGFGAKVSGLPIPAAYSNEDEIYFFPLTYGRTDTSTYNLDVNIAGIGRLIQQGRRITKVDGQGTIQTPYRPTNTDCMRVRTEVLGTDSVIFAGQAIPLPRNTVEYKWLAKGEHYPLLWLTTTVTPGGGETPTSIRYRDVARSTLKVDVSNIAPQSLAVYVDAAAGTLQLSLPTGWERNTVEVFDVQGRRAMLSHNARTVDISSMAAGMYLVRVTSLHGVGYAKAVL